ncbi:MAG: hypothetical protein FP825_06990 [Hyphomonas sp.]|uniref:intermembrane phospholipid transport protein YdbH family protein n=1 Tax=Hyphomonas sp. TaxID=87 RepID=UPI00184D8D40|nr:YdbH domain-containing protein [Hyphomonas sp.]MBA3068206.1 hypothetical protein [Hyphomonas sp.]MBU4060928.1 YdbH domain-containing protein [Alphaproteobacteria bacterium]MBU4164912.1 YdbH domain-containing protein [Alphaproteobacteria bacterium]
MAEQALAAWCADRDLQCDAKFTELDTSGITVSAVKVSSGSAVPAEAAVVRADIRWTGLFTPKVTGVTVNGLSMRGTLDGAGLRFGGLERLVQTGGGGGAAPPVDIRDARLQLMTPAGMTGATLSVSGTLPRNGELKVRLDPGEFSNPFASVNLREARLDMRAVDGQVEAELGVGIDEAVLGDNAAESFDLLARADFSEDAGKPASVEWSMRAARIASPDLRATDIRTSGRTQFSARPGASFAEILQELAGAVFEADAASLTLKGYTVDTAHLEGELAGRGGDVSGPLLLSTGIVIGPAGSATAASLGGELQSRKDGPVRFDGKFSVDGAALDADLRARTGAAFTLPGVLSAHVEALRAAIDRALAGFDATTDVTLQADGDALSVAATGEGALTASSGLRLTVAPDEGAPWVTVSNSGVDAAGAITLSGGGAPSAKLNVDRFAFNSGAVTLKAEAFHLARWTVGGRSLAAALGDIHLDNRPGALLFAGSGELSFTGEATGVRFAPTTIRGGLDGAWDESGWRVQSLGAPCLAVNTAGFTLGAIAAQPAQMDVCPVNGRFMRQGRNAGGTADLRAVRVPFTMQSGSGVLGLDSAVVDWTAGKTFDLTLRAAVIDLPMQIGERTLTILGAAPRIDVQTGKGPAKIVARLGETAFGGTMMPANVSASAFTFEGVSAPDGVEGAVTGTGVLITDTRTDALYEPIAAEFSGTLDETNRLKLTGPLKLRARGTMLADAALDINIVTLDGTAAVTSRPLDFRRSGLQPDMISTRLTGLFTDASGNVSSDAAFVIRDGDIEGTAEVFVREFGFQTTRLGRVSGVSGTVYFDDLMGLTTAPAQELQLASVNPGIPLADGRIVFDLRDKGILHLDTVTFPFGGGTLAIAPFDWALEGGLQAQSVDVTANAIQLAQLIEVLKLPDTTATGTVSGKFPIEFSGNRVQIRDARLRADEPGGRLSYTGGAVEAAAGQDANASLAFDALRDLKFSVLEVGIDGDLAGDLRADVLLAGENIKPLTINKSVTLPAGQPFEFAIGFDLPIGTLIENNLGLVTQKDVMDATIKLLNDGKPAPDETEPPPPE